MDKQDLRKLVIDALKANGGQATHIDIAKYIWQHHEAGLRASGDFFFAWQYHLRWVVSNMRTKGIIKKQTDAGMYSVFEL